MFLQAAEIPADKSFASWGETGTRVGEPPRTRVVKFHSSRDAAKRSMRTIKRQHPQVTAWGWAEIDPRAREYGTLL